MTTYPPGSPLVESLIAGRPAMLEVNDSTITRWTAHPARLEALQRTYGFHSMLLVPIRGRGATLGTAAFFRHQRPDPFTHDDLLLAEEITARAAVSIDNARRYTRERTTAVTLQRSLLPRKLPDQAALEAASR
ncbi:GAF domain-containing protein, partial [Streptomyces thermocarboxydovorans]|uniref:GAF domain-containing protein n=1 Tax=Streptomyces thermocarboxydovorans TaxID=59298 RepID=UPI0031D81A63